MEFYAKHRRAALKLLGRMLNLVELELSPWWPIYYGIAYLQPLSRLRHLRGIAISATCIGSDTWPNDAGIWIRVAKDLTTRCCWQPEKHASVSSHYGCFVCWKTTPAERAWFEEWKDSVRERRNGMTPLGPDVILVSEGSSRRTSNRPVSRFMMGGNCILWLYGWLQSEGLRLRFLGCRFVINKQGTGSPLRNSGKSADCGR